MKGKDLKPHIGIFGRRNNGKSSFINLLTGQNVAIVSDHPGTTTDPVKKSVEIFGVGPAIIIDTAGIDDSGDLGKLRIEKTMQVIPTIDLGIIILAENQFGVYENLLIEQFAYYDIPYIIVHNKTDIDPITCEFSQAIHQITGITPFSFSTKDPSNLEDLVKLIKQTIPETAYIKPTLLKGIVKPKDIVLLVTPIDSEAPEGRMILPQVMAWRDVLDNDCICISVKETELEDFFKLGIKPALVVTDSQAFDFVSKIVPQDVMLTGFSVLFSKLRGDFHTFLKDTYAIDKLQDGDKVLILESCTHHVSCDDIGRFKIPNWLKKYTGKDLEFDTFSGLSDINKPIDSYKLVVQCGGCMVTRKQLVSRLKPFIHAGIPVTNYGMAIAFMNGIFERVTEPFKNVVIND
ncbi:MAG: [FeFe] hydrogenase H-cluster maturation GTPase HydF [Bacteroidetes bacterium GWF2_33_16]|nr:MAG: [FeFe] hydrogenase H-cluster maturation GTPase HydF [Bacteroidetes bacterium GWE2_32_14]OFY05904.1 MAG: [FeFe] hydrogenase H-cluster maturation GTPase HydF [Bacteroidetes bacterium GWF2_33_16]